MTRSVVVGIDGSRESLVAAAWAAGEAALRDLPLRLVHAAPAPAPARDSAEGPVAFSWQQTGEELLQRARTDLARGCPHVATSGVQVTDAAPAALLSASETAELLVVGARGDGGFDGLVVGSTALAAASTASCPVAIVPGIPAAAARETEVCVGVDVAHAAEPPLDFAFGAAQLRDARLRAVYAWALSGHAAWTAVGVPEEDRAAWEDDEVQRLSDVLQGRKDTYPGVPVLPDVVLLHPAHALVQASRRADLLVLGRRSGLRAGERRLGPVAHAVLHHAHRPVVVVPHV
ncbi:universal stress protein [Streptomyces tropicalis]|uniref:Universal stress protein n=1 Tax=Streptomyces tropicalis TaxID=3034234 RepID=A0ABT6A1Q3_9ACTN|nr:universal stress protein [Streptomyces tropicalis]MDF3298555.1 universal stress protein [Streptomyces tropicalis]